jgi:hypothetical protein
MQEKEGFSGTASGYLTSRETAAVEPGVKLYQLGNLYNHLAPVVFPGKRLFSLFH